MVPDEKKLKLLYGETEQVVKEENDGSGLSQWIYGVRRSYICRVL